MFQHNQEFFALHLGSNSDSYMYIYGGNFLIKNNILKQTAKIVTLTLKLNQYNHF